MTRQQFIYAFVLLACEAVLGWLFKKEKIPAGSTFGLLLTGAVALAVVLFAKERTK